MSKITRIRHGQADDRDATPRIVELGSEEEDMVFDALSSETARAIYRALHEEPRTPSALADATDRSVQTVTYHLSKLESAALVEAAGTHYSEKGREMTVWAPANETVVIAEDAERAQRSLGEYFGLVVALALGSVAVQHVVDRFVAATPTGSPLLEPAGTGGGRTAFDGLLQTLAWLFATVEPGAIVFALGTLALVVDYYRRRGT